MSEQIRIRAKKELIDKLKELKKEKDWNDVLERLLKSYDPESYYLMKVEEDLTLLKQYLMKKEGKEAWRIMVLSASRRLLEATVKSDRKEVLMALIDLEQIVR